MHEQLSEDGVVSTLVSRHEKDADGLHRLPLKGPPLTRDVLRSDHPRRSSREAAVKQRPVRAPGL